jgi:OOP family OmpA-OmpF porin
VNYHEVRGTYDQKKSLLIFTAIFSLFLFGGICQAEGKGWYAGASVGVSIGDDFVDANDDGSLTGISSDDSDTSFKAYGGYNFTKNIGVEAGYEDHGETSMTAVSDGSADSWEAGDIGTDFEANGWYAAVVGRLPVSARWTLFARLGMYAWDTTETWTEPKSAPRKWTMTATV